MTDRELLEAEWKKTGGNKRIDPDKHPAKAERNLIAAQMLDRLDLVEEYVKKHLR